MTQIDKGQGKKRKRSESIEHAQKHAHAHTPHSSAPSATFLSLGHPVPTIAKKGPGGAKLTYVL